jgi:hypothetical protein
LGCRRLLLLGMAEQGQPNAPEEQTKRFSISRPEID